MEEADAIILLQLREAGCALPESVVSLKQLDGGAVYDGCYRVLAAAKQAAELPKAMPTQRSQAFRVGEAMAATLKELGYPAELGYQNFMYPSVADTRRLFSWLIELLPRHDAAQQQQQLQAQQQQAMLQQQRAARTQRTDVVDHVRRAVQAAREAVAQQVQAQAGGPVPVVASLARPSGPSSTLPMRTEGVFVPTQERVAAGGAALQAHLGAHHRVATAQPRDARHSLMSVLEGFERATVAERRRAALGLSDAEVADAERRRKLVQRQALGAIRAAVTTAEAGEGGINAGSSVPLRGRRGGRGVMDGSRFQHATNFAAQQPTDEAAGQRQTEAEREQEIAALQDRLRDLQEQLENTGAQKSQKEGQLRAAVAREEADLKRLQEVSQQHRLRKQMFDMQADLQGNLAKLREISAATAQRLLDLAAEWEEHRVQLLHAYREAKSGASERQRELRELLEERERVRDEMRRMVQLAREKEALCAALQEELARLPKNLTRGTYTFRILEIIKNVKKQQVDIDRILIDIHNSRREINQVSGALGRSFAAADEAVYREARKSNDEQVKEIYRKLVSMHEKFQSLVSKVEEGGRIVTRTRELERRIEQLQARVADQNYEQIAADLAAVRQENRELQQGAR